MCLEKCCASVSTLSDTACIFGAEEKFIVWLYVWCVEAEGWSTESSGRLEEGCNSEQGKLVL